MFSNAIILYGSSFWETAATQNCGHTQGISLTSLVQAGTDCRPSSGCAALSDSESARLGHGAARQRFTGILDHDLFGCSCELELTVEPPAKTGGKQVGLEIKPRSARASWAEAKLGQNLKYKSENFQG